MNRSTPGLPVHHQLPESTQTHVHQVGDAIQPSHPLSFPSPPAPNASQHQTLSSELTLHIRWPKYWSFSFSISPSNEYSGLISFRIYFSDLLAVQGTLKSLFQHHSSKVSIIRHSTFFMAQLSHPYYWKKHAFDCVTSLLSLFINSHTEAQRIELVIQRCENSDSNPGSQFESSRWYQYSTQP